MTSQIVPKRFALLVGIDLYLSDGSRKAENGDLAWVRDLLGCVNDVKAIEDFLYRNFQLYRLYILTSPPSTDPKISMESEDDRPTFDNIKRQFDKVKEEAQPGDLFFFHFSGHGSRLKRTKYSPEDGRDVDPSLLTADYCCGKPAIRGWQLNTWLKDLTDKKVQVVVNLDSCYSGGSWRNDDHVRTSTGCTLSLNLPVDEAAAQETSLDLNHRNSKLDVSWDMNPQRFTLMTACKSDERATEKSFCGTYFGSYTHEFLRYLGEILPKPVTYRTLRDELVSRIQDQTPQAYGQDRLAFFGSKEPFSVTPTVFKMEEDRVVLPIGKFHAVKKGAQFTTYPSASAITLSIDRVDDIESRTKHSPQLSQTLLQYHSVIPCRWCLGSDTLKIRVDPGLGNRFQDVLSTSLREKIAGHIEVDEGDTRGSVVAHFELHKREGDAIDISSSLPLAGRDEYVWSLDFMDEDVEEGAKESAIAIAHLFRFGQILNLRYESSQDTAPFDVVVDPAPDKAPVSHGQKVRLTFENQTGATLYFAVMILSLGFHVKQLYPSSDSSVPVQSGKTKSFQFQAIIPESVRARRTAGAGQTYRDTLRTIVTTGEMPSLKSLELPDIWNAGDWEAQDESHSGRHGRYMSDVDNLTWWIKDIETDIAFPGDWAEEPEVQGTE